ncbi:DUF1990 family protein [Thermomonospora umbrina]|uniref:Uncharacterized protein (UPF0548 family) n=1 Tax=Thermomonospora umbrina TaxID=111806 RepID=A0A3D9T1X3_9ACTN|nr:DUF1990 domain-containing protein [Thermomonospora umbrina]REE99235.1 uncharacterized protein (UPF0548 family) [Thermomonospora umbrina]
MNFTYDEVGATRTGVLPDGYDHLRVRRRLGHGAAVMRDAAEALVDFRMHRGIPVRVDASGPYAEPGVTVTVRVGVGPLAVVAPCRVVWAERDERRAAWAYGTLPGHPRRGEEAFVVEMDDTGDVWLTVLAFSRSAGPLGRAAGPLVRALQRAYALRCVASLRRLVRRSAP